MAHLLLLGQFTHSDIDASRFERPQGFSRFPIASSFILRGGTDTGKWAMRCHPFWPKRWPNHLS
jgi:hypothetical protein